MTTNVEFVEIVDNNIGNYYLAVPQEKGQFTTAVAGGKWGLPIHGQFIVENFGEYKTLIDVGSNIGTISIPAAKSGLDVIGLEILPENCLLHSMAQLKNKLKNIKLFQMAGSDENTLVSISGEEAWGRVRKQGDNLSKSVSIKIDDLLEITNVQQPIVLKIDTEGHELDVLKGMKKLIRTSAPDIIFESVECEGHWPNKKTLRVKKFLEQRGYNLYLFRRNQKLLVPRTADDVQEWPGCDYFATQKKLEDGEKYGTFLVRKLSLDDSIRWLQQTAAFNNNIHRIHAAGVIVKFWEEWKNNQKILDLCETLIKDKDKKVSSQIKKVLSK